MFLHWISYWIGDVTCFFPSPFIFRVLVEQLEKVKLSQLDGDAQIAFWINVHNALVMHVIFIWRNNVFCLKIFQAYVTFILEVSMHNSDLLLSGIFSIRNSPGLSQEASLVSQGSSLFLFNFICCSVRSTLYLWVQGEYFSESIVNEDLEGLCFLQIILLAKLRPVTTK